MPALAASWFYFRNLRNWREVGRARLSHQGGPLTLRLRDRTTLALLDSEEEIWAFWSIYGGRCYDRDFSAIPADGVVIDLGANVGIFAVYAAGRLVPRGRVVAVEPNPKLLAVLRANALAKANVVVMPVAVAAAAGTRTLHVTRSSLCSSLYDDGHGLSVPTRVDCVGFAELLDAACGPDGRVALLKCNAEGIEYPLLLETAAELWSRVDRLAIKYHEGALAGGRDSRLLLDGVERLGYRALRHETVWRTAELTTGIITATRVP